MAPIAISSSIGMMESSTAKRSATAAGFGESKKLQHPQLRHHSLKWKQEIPSGEGSEETFEIQLRRAIALALAAVGYEHATPIALDTFRVNVEAYMQHFLASVRKSMLSCRRSQPLPQDFLYALHSHQLTLRSLLPHLDPPVNPHKSQPRLFPVPRSETDDTKTTLIDALFHDASTARPKHIPMPFPTLPSQHTFKAEPVFTKRERDPRTLRERATEESRLGEEALRRLVGAAAVSQSKQAARGKGTNHLSRRAQGEQLWKIATEDSFNQRTSSGKVAQMIEMDSDAVAPSSPPIEQRNLDLPST